MKILHRFTRGFDFSVHSKYLGKYFSYGVKYNFYFVLQEVKHAQALQCYCSHLLTLKSLDNNSFETIIHFRYLVIRTSYGWKFFLHFTDAVFNIKSTFVLILTQSLLCNPRRLEVACTLNSFLYNKSLALYKSVFSTINEIRYLLKTVTSWYLWNYILSKWTWTWFYRVF